MDHLKELVSTFSNEDQKEFKTFLNRSRRKDSRKDLELFDLFSQKRTYTRDEILAKLYPEDKNLEAYHATRKRLIKNLHDFIYIKQINEDISSVSQLESSISLIRYLFHHKKDKTAWSYFGKAVIQGEKSQNYSQLISLFQLGIENSIGEHAWELDDLIRKFKHYRGEQTSAENIKLANQIIKQRIHAKLEAGKSVDYNDTIASVYKKYDIPKEDRLSPKLLFDTIEVVRRYSMTKKDFANLEPYLLNNYLKLEKKMAFDKYNHHLKVNILYFVSHVLFRNKKFRDAEIYLEKYHTSIFAYGQRYLKQNYQKYALLKANIFIYTNRLEPAVSSLEMSLNNALSKEDVKQQLNTYIILSIGYFLQSEFDKCHKVFHEIKHSDAWCQRMMGKEWLLKRSILDTMSQFELGNFEIVDARIKSIRRKFKDLFEQERYKRVGTFLTLVQKINNDPSVASTQQFAEMVDQSFEWTPKESEDLQAMTFYAWLKSKMVNQPFYDVLVDLVSN